ncbi:MAG: TIGR00341 family protein [Halioglobus sp.]|nr:TIGR00341 family protein [Halioglobus sp.]
MYLIHDKSLTTEAQAELTALGAVSFVPWADRTKPPASSRVLLYLGDEMLRELALLALERQWEVGVLPHAEARQAMAALGVKGDLKEVFAHYLDVPAIDSEALTCNGEVVFSSVVIGRVLALRPYDINRPPTTWALLSGALRGLGKLRLAAYTLTTAKAREIHMAALGMVVVGQSRSSLVHRTLTEEFGVADGRLAMLSLAPRSVASYLVFLLRLLWPRKLKLSQLPNSLSLVQTDRLHIAAPKGVDYLLDGKPVHASEIEFAVLKEPLRVLPGPAIPSTREKRTSVDKETVRLNQVPVDAAAEPLLQRNLPVFTHASEEDYRELFVSLRDNARVTPSYQVLMVLSVLLALAGLYANSAPVIIGAMILAPLMSPIVSLAMGLARSESGLMRSSLRALAVGVAWGLSCGVIIAWITPLEIPTAEMRARMSPTLLDLLVAILSGVAGAYASAKEEIAKSLAGVAIAVALVPPLSVTGIGLGWGDWDMAAGASLLLVTNLVGIALAASATFLVLGFAPFKRARAGLGVTLVILMLISAPLTLSFSHLVSRENILEHVPRGDIQLTDMVVHIESVDVTLGDPATVSVVLSSEHTVHASDVDQLKEIISEKLGLPIRIEVQSNILR